MGQADGPVFFCAAANSLRSGMLVWKPFSRPKSFALSRPPGVFYPALWAQASQRRLGSSTESSNCPHRVFVPPGPGDSGRSGRWASASSSTGRLCSSAVSMSVSSCIMVPEPGWLSSDRTPEWAYCFRKLPRGCNRPLLRLHRLDRRQSARALGETSQALGNEAPRRPRGGGKTPTGLRKSARSARSSRSRAKTEPRRRAAPQARTMTTLRATPVNISA